MLRYSEWIFRAVILAAIIANIWLTQSFVTRNEFDRVSRENLSAHLVIQTSIADIAMSMKLLAANVVKLDDHEMRLRVVEMRQTDVLARLHAIEQDQPKTKP